jgi:hypothetical protein
VLPAVPPRYMDYYQGGGAGGYDAYGGGGGFWSADDYYVNYGGGGGYDDYYGGYDDFDYYPQMPYGTPVARGRGRGNYQVVTLLMVSL